MMPHKKIIFVIVEGPSDEDAIGTLLSRFYNGNEVHIHVVHGDITTQRCVNPHTIVTKIGNLVRQYAGRTFKQTDFCGIIHLADTDGAFIPDDDIVESNRVSKTTYSETDIQTNNKSLCEKRNKLKRENMKRLATTPTIWNIPYRIYYMSRNLDHVLYGKPDSSDAEKERNSLDFALKYKDDIQSFIDFISKSGFSIMCEYSQSWEYITIGLHSLERHTNFGLCFTDVNRIS